MRSGTGLRDESPPSGRHPARRPRRARGVRHARARSRSANRRFRRGTEILGALVVSVGVVVVAHSAFGAANPFVVTTIGYLGFLATIVLVEFADAGRVNGDEIDLTVDEPFDVFAPAEPTAALRSVTDEDRPDVPMRRRKVTGADAAELGVAMVAAAAFAELLRLVFRMRSLVGLGIWWYVAFIAIYFVLVRDRSDVERALDRVVTVLVVTTGLAVAAVLGWMVAFVVAKGASKFTWTFFTEDLSRTGPLTPGGGAKHAMIGTLEQVGLATLLVVPIGILTAVYLNEIGGRLARPIRFIVDAMAGLPSIVAGLLVFTILVEDHGFSGVSGSIALAILMVPTMTLTSEQILRTVPDGLREGALALGSPQWRLVMRVVLPTALAGLVTAALLAVARAIGETAPMLLTAFGADTTNTNPAKGPQSDLPLFVWKLFREPDKTQQARAFTGALVLVLMVFVLFVSARLIATRGMRKLGRAR